MDNPSTRARVQQDCVVKELTLGRWVKVAGAEKL
jgi:hypothetical protein